MLLSIIIPVYNEEDTITTLVRAVLSVQLKESVTKEILIVNDGSTDSTVEKLKEFENLPEVRIFNESSNRGKTYAVKKGIGHASGDIILIQDADLEYSPGHYPALIEPILQQKTNVVYGSRFLGDIKNMTWINRTANRISNLTINALYQTKMTDFHTCYKVFRADILKSLPIKSKNFSFDTEITARLLHSGEKIFEVPIDYVARKKGKKITWGSALETYFFLLKYRLKPDD